MGSTSIELTIQGCETYADTRFEFQKKKKKRDGERERVYNVYVYMWLFFSKMTNYMSSAITTNHRPSHKGIKVDSQYSPFG